MRLYKENTIGLVVDMQEKLLPHITHSDEIKDNCIKLIKGLNILDVPIVVTQQYTKGLGPTDDDVNKAIGNFSYIEKMAFSCYRQSDFIKVLNKSGKRNVVIMGIESHICVLQTALDLLYNNFNPVVVTNAIGSRKAEDKQIALWRMRDVGSIMTTYESILFELCKQAGTDEFKAISKLVK
ncbi:MAG TPA: hydrolase [Bacteroidales bacterium]|jgi:nicotinamidase-related amidase|nr:hydrolase [Bacteroidales bacterium]